MTSLFLRAVASLRSAAQSAAAQAAQPTHVPAAPVVWDKRNEEELKRSIPLSFSPPTSLSHTHVYPRGGVTAATARRQALGVLSEHQAVHGEAGYQIGQPAPGYLKRYPAPAGCHI